MDAVRAAVAHGDESEVARALSLIGLGQLIAGQREGEDLVVGRVCTAWATRRLLDMGTAQIQVEQGRTPTGPSPKLKLGMKKASLRLSTQCARLLAARASMPALPPKAPPQAPAPQAIPPAAGPGVPSKAAPTRPLLPKAGLATGPPAAKAGLAAGPPVAKADQGMLAGPIVGDCP